jgi:putative MATE family efflux protein
MGLAWPVVIEQVLALAVGLINTYLVGHLGGAALAAVGLSDQLRLLLVGLFSAIGVGSTALVARHVGAGEPEAARVIAGQALLLAVVVGLLAIPPCVVWGDALLAILGAAEDVVVLGGAYLLAVGSTMPLTAILFIGNATLRGAGDTRTPMLVMGLVNLINAGLSWVLVRGLGPLPAYGVLGAGIGLAVSVGVGGLVVGLVLLCGRSTAAIRVMLADLRFRPQQAARLLRIGLPGAGEQGMMRGAHLALSSVVANLGTAAFAGHQLGLQLLSISYMPGLAFSVATTTLVGQELGRGAPRRATACVYTAAWMAMGIMYSAAAVAFLLTEPLLRIFTSESDVIGQGYHAVRVGAIIQLPLAWYFALSGALRGAGDTRYVLLAQALPIWLVRIPLASRLGLAAGLGLSGVWIAMLLDMTGRAVLMMLRFRNGAWKRLKV